MNALYRNVVMLPKVPLENFILKLLKPVLCNARINLSTLVIEFYNNYQVFILLPSKSHKLFSSL